MNILKYFILIAIMVGVFIQINTSHVEKEAGKIESASEANINQINIENMSRTAHIDPDTGELISNSMGSSFQNKQLITKQNSLPAVELLAHSNGTIQAKLNGRFRAPLVAQIACDGKIIMTHAENDQIEDINCEETK